MAKKTVEKVAIKRIVQLLPAVLLITVLLQVYPGCREVPLNTQEDIYGLWEWKLSVGSLTGIQLTPESVGFTRSVEFNRDGTFRSFINGTVVESGRFSVDTGQSELNGIIYLMIRFGLGQPMKSIRYLDQHIMILTEECIDCFTHTYEK